MESWVWTSRQIYGKAAGVTVAFVGMPQYQFLRRYLHNLDLHTKEFADPLGLRDRAGKDCLNEH